MSEGTQERSMARGIDSECREQVKLAERTFTTRDIQEYHEQVHGEYVQFFQSKHYIEVLPVNVASGFDSTTKFVGSTISRFKPFFVENTISENGMVVVQPCIRTQNKQNLYRDEEKLAYNTCFSIIGGIAPSYKTKEICADVLAFFIEKLGVDRSRILVRISSQDADLLEGVDTISTLEQDGRDPQYYRWKYGMPGVVGRGLTIAIQNESTGNYDDIGNIIVMDEEGFGSKAVQWGFGVETLVSRVFSKTIPLEASLIRQVYNFNGTLEVKFADTLATAIEMLLAGVILNKKTEGYDLRDYLKGLGYLRGKINLPDEDLTAHVRGYIQSKQEKGVSIDEVNDVVKIILESVKNHDVAVERFHHALRNLSEQYTGEQVFAMLSDESMWMKWSQKFGLHKLEVTQIIKSYFKIQ